MSIKADTRELAKWLNEEPNREIDRQALARVLAHLQQAEQAQPFGYFKAEPFGWTDCAETDEGAIALYEAPPPRQPEQAEPVAFIEAAAENDCAYAYADGWNACIRAYKQTSQPPALRLADAYEATGLRGHIEAAAELRRLHAANQELLEALKAADWYIGQLEPFVYGPDDNGVHDEHAKVRAAIAKHGGAA